MNSQKQSKSPNSHEPQPAFTLLNARETMRNFVAQRQWQQFHTPRNLVMALMGEVGQVAQIFQWKGEVKVGVPQLSTIEKNHLGDELADVFAYLVRLADVCEIDLTEAFLKKMKKNGEKYPAELVRGSSKKYSEYKENYKKEQ